MRLAIAIIGGLIFAGQAEAQDSVDALKRFEGMIAGLEGKASVPEQVRLTKTGEYVKESLRVSGVSYDVKRTDSLVSPFLGQVQGVLARHSHSRCPAYVEEMRRWNGLAPEPTCPGEPATTAAAVKDAPLNFEEVETFEALYAYQDGRWLLRSVRYSSTIPGTRGRPDSPFYDECELRWPDTAKGNVWDRFCARLPRTDRRPAK
jgi:hypothetical protein